MPPSRILALATLTVAALAAPASAAQWTDPFDVSQFAADRVSDGHDVVVAPDGTTTVLWVRDDPSASVVQLRRIGPDGVAGPIVDLPATIDTTSVDADVGPDGVITMVWRQASTPSVIRGLRIAPDGTLGPELDVSVPADSASSPTVDVTADGGASVGYTAVDGADYELHVRRIEPAGTVGDDAVMATAPGLKFAAPVVADDDGAATLVWRETDGATQVVRARRVSVSGTRGPTIDVSDTSADADEPRIAIGPAGDRVVVWWSGPPLDGDVVHARRLLPGAALGPILDVSTDTGRVSWPQVAVDADGAATVTWEQIPVSGQRVVHARRVAADDTLGTVHALSGDGEAAWNTVAVDAAARAWVAWSRLPAGGVAVAETATVGADDVATPAEVRSAQGEEANVVRLATGPADRAALAWDRIDASGRTVRATLLRPDPPAVPPPPPPEAPAAGGAPLPPGPPSVAASGCATVGLRSVAATSRGRTRSRTSRRRGVTALLKLTRAGRLKLDAATLTLRHRGRTRKVKLGTRTADAASELVLRLALPASAGRVPVGTTTTLVLDVRTRDRAGGCSYGAKKRRTLRLKLAWVPR